ncbi:MAG: zinc ribbon domain-containing protein [Promethearchaeia archaeon]
MTNGRLYEELIKMGDRWYYIAILTILSFIIPVIPGIIIFIFFILILGNAKRIAQELNDKKMKEFRKYYLYSIIVMFVGIVVAIFFGVIMYSFMYSIASSEGYYTTSSLNVFPFLGVMGGVLVMFIIVGILQYKAFGKLNESFVNNKNLFPQHIGEEVIDGSKKLKTAALCVILAFLVVTLIIAIIYQIIGYFKLAKLRDLKYSQGQPQQDQPPAVEDEEGEPVNPEALEDQPPAPSTGQARFCPVCGSRLEGNEKYCGKCGSELDL